MILKAVVHEEDGGYWAEIPALPGCFTQADNLEELKANLKKAAEGWLEAADIVSEKEGCRTGQPCGYC